MDKRDEQIFECLLQNCRLTTKEIAKITKIPQTTVSYKIHQLEEKEIISKYDGLINFSLIFDDVQIFLISHKDTKNNEFEEKVHNNSSIASLLRVSNPKNYFLFSMFDSTNEENKFLKEISNEVISYEKYSVQNIEIFPFSIYDSKIKVKLLPKPTQKIKLEKIDYKILNYLSNGHGRISILELTKQLKSTYDIISYRFKRLKDNGYFSLFLAQPSITEFHLQVNYLHLQLKNNISSTQKKRLEQLKSVIAIIELNDNNYLVNFLSKDFKDYKETFETLSELFKEEIEYFNMLNVKNWTIINRFPFEKFYKNKN